MKSQIKIFTFLCLIFCISNIQAQNYTIETNLLLLPPYPTNLDAYVDYLEQGIVEVNNLSNEAQEVYFSVLFEESTGKISVNTNGVLGEPILMQPGINIFTPQDIETVFGNLSEENYSIAGLSQAEQNAILLNRQMPEGDYRICIDAFDEFGARLSDPSMGCTTLDIFYAERPIILSPFDDQAVDTSGFLFITWDQIINSPGILNRLEYTLKIIDLTEEAITNIELGMLETGVPAAYEEELGNVFSVNLADDVDIFMEIGHRYAMRVTAVDPEESLGFQFGGHSEIVTFTYGEIFVGGGDLLAAPEIVAPESDEELEADASALAIEVEWEHEDGGENGLLSYSGKMIDLTENELEEITLAQMLSEDYEAIWEDDGFQQIIIIESEDDAELIPGNVYAVLVSVTSTDEADVFENDGHSEIVVFAFGEAEGELKLPVIESPVAESYFDTPEISLTWLHDIEDETGLTYTLQVIDLTDQKVPSPNVEDFQNTEIKKMWDEAITLKTKSLKPIAPLTFTLYHKYAIAISVESSDEEIEFGNDGYSEIVTFTHGLEVADPDGCTGGDCTSDLPADITSVAIKSVGLKNKKFTMGDLEFQITDLEKGGDAAGGYSGEGTVKVGFIGPIGARIKVEFSDIKVNAAGQVVAGTADAIFDDDFSKFDKLAAVGASTALDIDFDTAKDLAPSLRAAGRFASLLAGQPVGLPLGFDKVIEEDTSVVGITKMSFSPEKSEMLAIFTLQNDNWGEYVPSFGADKICFKNSGFANQVRLYLSEDYTIITDAGSVTLRKTDIGNPAELGTYVELNCKGFKEAQLTLDIPVDRDILMPVDDTGAVIDDEETRVIFTMTGKIERQSNFILAASASPCEIPGLDGFSITLTNGFYDSSERSNPAGLEFPNGYGTEETRPIWKGVWFEEISITAPADWAGASGGERTKVGMNNFIKDDAGISVNGIAYNLLGIDKGSYEGFAISMDTLNINILHSQFVNVSIGGKMGLPILPEGKYMNYQGIVDHADKLAEADNPTTPKAGAAAAPVKASMVFTVDPGTDAYYIPSIKSSLRFDETTQIIIKSDSKEKGIKAIIEGSLAIGNTEGIPADEIEDPDENVLTFPALKFTGMTFSSLRPTTAPTSSTNQAGNNTSKSTMKMTRPVFELAGYTPAPGGGGGGDEEEATTGETAAEEKEEPKVNGFHIGLTEVSMAFGEGGETEETEATDGMEMKLTIGGEIAIVRAATAKKGAKKAKKGFELSAEGTVSMVSLINKIDGKYTFTYDRIQAATLKVESELGPIGISGELEIYNKDPDFGKGVVGAVKIEVPLLTVDVEARFGTMSEINQEDFSYFYLFGKVDVEAGIPIPATPLKLHRFLGGAYSNMSVKAGSELAEAAKDKYEPNSDVAFGFKAGLGFSVGSPGAVFATMAFEMAVNDDGGIERIALDGQVDMMMEDPFGDLSGSNFEGIRLKANATVFPPLEGVVGREELKLDASFLAKANLADGTVVGAQEGGELYQVVSGKLNIDGKGFEIILGTYEVPGVVQVVLGEDAGIDASFYLQASSGKVPTFTQAPVPAFIRELLDRGKGNEDQDDFTTTGGDPEEGKDANTYPTEGLAIAAGLNVTVEADVAYSILYANFKAMLGFDMSLTANANTVCSNLGGTAIGMGEEGYYGKGQVYAGLEGAVGLDVDVFGYKGKIELASVYAAMLLQGGFANPSWVTGEAAMGYSVLGGLVTGNTSFEIQIGEKCEEYQADPFAGVKFIEGIDPDKNKLGVSVFVKPILSFQNKIGYYEFKNGNGAMQSYDVRLERFEIIGKNFSKNIASDKLSAHLDVTSLSPNTTYTIVAEVKVYKKGDNGYWYPAISNTTGQEVVEKQSHNFRTGEMPDYVPWNNIEDMYPFRNESYYMIEDNVYDQGIIKLIGGQAKLFEPFTPSGQQWHCKVQAWVYDYAAKAWIHNTDVTYYAATNIILFNLPKNKLNTSNNYNIRLVRRWYLNTSYDTSSKVLQDEIVSNSSAALSSSYTIKKEGKTYANASNKKPADKTLFDYTFNTSKYRSFSKKANDGYASAKWQHTQIVYTINNSEGFSEHEIGAKYIPESKSLKMNTAFVQETLGMFVGFSLLDIFEGINEDYKAVTEEVATSFPQDMDIFKKHKFQDGEWREGFDFFDLPSRKLYINLLSSNIKLRSNSLALCPTLEDIKKIDWMLCFLLESYREEYKAHDSKAYETHYNNWYHEAFNASDGGVWGIKNSLSADDVNYRVSYFWKEMLEDMNAETQYLTTFIYSVPYVSGGKYYTRTSSRTPITFKKQ